MPFIVLTLLATLGATLLLAVAGELGLRKETVPYVFVEHLGSALVVGAVLGFTYEWLLHRKREEYIEALASKQIEATAIAVKDLVSLSPRSVLGLLEAIATRIVGKIPTLYITARDATDEYTFAGDLEYFTSLVRSSREQVVDVLREWLQDKSDPRLKFLASDFVGMFQLDELRDDLERQIHFSDWEQLSPVDKAWRLNYVWAHSRSDPVRTYVELAQLAQTTPYRDILEWIMFIPEQMQDREFLKVIDAYLCRTDLNTDDVRLTLHALALLWGPDSRGVCAILKRHAHVFGSDGLDKALEIQFRRENIPPDRVLEIVHGASRQAVSR